MSITDFFTTLFVIKRASWATDEDDNPYSEEVEVGQFMGHIQQASADLVQNLGMTLTSAFSVWCPLDSGIKAGDTLSSVGGVYSVKAIQKYEIGGNKHIEAVVRLDSEVLGS